MKQPEEAGRQEPNRNGAPPHPIARRIVHFLDSAVDYLILFAILIAALFGAFSLWDNGNMYDAAAPTALETYKPDKEPYLSFEELEKINPDVFAWVTVYGTNIDYPVTHYTDNDKYINTDAKGEFALHGCPFLDCNNKRDFSDLNNIIYGHHMEQNMMFGDLDLFLAKRFFQTHRYGNLYYGGGHHGLEIFAVIEADAYDFTIYDTQVTSDNQDAYIDHIYDTAKFSRDISLKKGDHVVLLSTCAGGLTNLRYIVAAKICDKTFKDPFAGKAKAKKDIFFLLTLPKWWYVLAGLALLILLLLLWRRKRKTDGEENEEGDEANGEIRQ